MPSTPRVAKGGTDRPSSTIESTLTGRSRTAGNAPRVDTDSGSRGHIRGTETTVTVLTSMQVGSHQRQSSPGRSDTMKLIKVVATAMIVGGLGFGSAGIGAGVATATPAAPIPLKPGHGNDDFCPPLCDN